MHLHIVYFSVVLFVMNSCTKYVFNLYLPKEQLPVKFDWREQFPNERGAISKVNHQSSCRACWAFSTADVAGSDTNMDKQFIKSYFFTNVSAISDPN